MMKMIEYMPLDISTTAWTTTVTNEWNIISCPQSYNMTTVYSPPREEVRLTPISCPECGGKIKFFKSGNVAKCKYCETLFKVEGD